MSHKKLFPFSRVREIKRLYDELEALKGEKFNIFKILNVHADEVRLHSRFLAELLNPKGMHLQGGKFLDLFVKSFFPEFDFNAEYAKIKIEKVIDDNRRLDIFLEDDKGRKIIIENKIYAGDQDKQLFAYHKFAEKSGADFKLIYLTLKGNEPTEKSSKELQKDSHFICMSYQEDISEWLKACQKEVLDIPILRETIKQYLINLGFLTNQSMNQEYLNKIEGILAEDDNYLLIKDIEKAFTSLKISSLQKLMHELSEKLKVLPGLEGKDVFFTDKTTKIEPGRLREFIEIYYLKDTASQFGICIRLAFSSTPNLAFKIELNYSLYYGFASSLDGSLIPLNNQEKKFIDDALSKNPHILSTFIKEGHSDLYRRVLENKIPFHPKEITEDGLKILIDKGAREQWIGTFIDGIKEVLLLVQKDKEQTA